MLLLSSCLLYSFLDVTVLVDCPVLFLSPTTKCHQPAGKNKHEMGNELENKRTLTDGQINQLGHQSKLTPGFAHMDQKVVHKQLTGVMGDCRPK